jgi:hypothetical protein
MVALVGGGNKKNEIQTVIYKVVEKVIKLD